MKILAIGLLAISSSLVSAQTIPAGWVNIVSENSGKCLDMLGGPRAIGPGVRADQWTCDGPPATNQIFRLIAVSGGYEIVADNSGLAVEVVNGSTANGTEVVQEPYMGDGYQIWKLKALAGGYYSFSPESDQASCMDVSAVSKANNAYVQEWICNHGPNQAWKFVPVTISNPNHTVDLTWQPSVSPGVLSYNIYRSTGTGQLARIASGITTTAYADSSIIDSDSYTYAATAVDGNNNESSYSNLFSIAIPNN